MIPLLRYRESLHRADGEHGQESSLLPIGHLQTHDHWNGQDEQHDIGQYAQYGCRNVKSRLVDAIAVRDRNVPALCNRMAAKYQAEEDADRVSDYNENGGVHRPLEPTLRRDLAVEH